MLFKSDISSMFCAKTLWPRTTSAKVLQSVSKRECFRMMMGKRPGWWPGCLTYHACGSFSFLDCGSGPDIYRVCFIPIHICGNRPNNLNFIKILLWPKTLVVILTKAWSDYLSTPNADTTLVSFASHLPIFKMSFLLLEKVNLTNKTKILRNSSHKYCIS